MDTINIMPYIPTSLPGVENIIMSKGDGGLYYSGYYSLSYRSFMDGGIEGLADEFGSGVKSCGNSPWDYIEHFGAYPPSVSVAQDVFVTYLEFELVDITLTVYDAAAESTTVNLPNLKTVYTTKLEEETAP